MKALSTISLAAAATLAALLLASPALSLPAAPAAAWSADVGLVEAAKWKQKHGRVKAKHRNRGNHYGWSLGRGHQYGWSRGRGHKLGLRGQGRY